MGEKQNQNPLARKYHQGEFIKEERTNQMKTQRERVLDYMRTHNGITSMDAFELGITRLSARIYELRHQDGINILEENITKKNRYNETCTYSRYYLGELR